MEEFEEGVVLMCIGVLGIIGNIISIPYFGNKIRRQKTFYTLLTCLSIIDLVVVITGLLLYAVSKLSKAYKHGTYFIIAPYLYPIFEIGSTGSIYFTIAISIERYFVVCRPFWYHEKAIPSWRYTIPILCFSVMYNVPRFFEVKTVTQSQNTLSAFRFNETSVDRINNTQIYLNNTQNVNYSVEPTELRKNVHYYGIYHIGCAMVFQFLIPLLVLIIANGLILRQLIKDNYEAVEHYTYSENHSTQRLSNAMTLRQLNSPTALDLISEDEPLKSFLTPTHIPNKYLRHKSQVSRAKVTLAICGVFTICHVFKWVLNIYELYIRFGSNNISEEETEDKMEESKWFITVLNISNTLVVLNSSINFYIYLLKACWTMQE